MIFSNAMTGTFIGLSEPSLAKFPLIGSAEVGFGMTSFQTSTRFLSRTQDAEDKTFGLVMWASNRLWPVKISDSDKRNL